MNVASSKEYRTFETLSEKFSVLDIVSDRTKLIFVLESPHKEELKYGFPVSGPSGADMTEVITRGRIKYPLGRLLGTVSEDSDLKSIGILNICDIPMQSIAYPTETAKEYFSFFEDLERVRTGYNTTRFKSNQANDIRLVILYRLAKRLLPYRNCALIPCGRFAQEMLKLEERYIGKLNIPMEVPHPSYNGWRKGGEEFANKLIEVVNKCLRKEL